MGEEGSGQKSQKKLYFTRFCDKKGRPYDPIEIAIASSASWGADYLPAAFPDRRIAVCTAMRRRFAWF
jgi:hypothetical protein